MSFFFVAIILGLIQGLGEFLPISSSGHLVLAQAFFGLQEPEMAFNVTLHLGTLGAVVIFYRHYLCSLTKELRFLPQCLSHPARLKEFYQTRPDFRFGLLIVVGTIPTGIMGLTFQNLIKNELSSVSSVGMALIITGFLLRLVGQRGKVGRSGEEMTLSDALIIGFIQGLAIVPGFSRSGFTICAGLFLGLDRTTAARYSFILSIPAILGAAILELRHFEESTFNVLDFLAGFLVAGICGYLALKLLINLLQRDNFSVFSWWCWAVGLVALSRPWWI